MRASLRYMKVLKRYVNRMWRLTCECGWLDECATGATATYLIMKHACAKAAAR